MIDPEFEAVQDLWQAEDEPAQDVYQLRQSLMSNVRRARQAFLLGVCAAVSMAVILIAIMYMFWTPVVGALAAMAIGFLLIGLAYQWRYSRGVSYDSSGSAIDLVEVAITRSKKQISKLKMNLFALVPSLILGTLLGKAMIKADPLHRINAIVGPDESRWIFIGGAVCLTAVVVVIGLALKRETERLKGYMQLRETLIEEK